MTIQINGTSGISGVDGSAGTPALQGTDTNTGISFGTDTVNINTGGNTRATVDSSGRLLVGTTTASTTGASKLFQVVDSAGASIGLGRTSGATISDGQLLGGIEFLGSGLAPSASIQCTANGEQSSTSDLPSDLGFFTTPNASGTQVERARITRDGRFGLGNINPSYFADLKVASNARLAVHNSGTALPLIGFADGSSNYQDGRIDAYSLKIITGSGSLFGGSSGVNLANGATSWAAQSDERLKTNLAPIENGLTKVASLRAVTGRYLIDDPEKSRSFLIAQDVQAVLPEAVFADNDENETLNLRYTEVIPLLVAALKESKERIEQLETRVAQLEGGTN